MEQVFFRLHHRFVTAVTKFTSHNTRRRLEHLLLFAAIFCLLALIFLHLKFGQLIMRDNCLSRAIGDKHNATIVRLHITDEWPNSIIRQIDPEFNSSFDEYLKANGLPLQVGDDSIINACSLDQECTISTEYHGPSFATHRLYLFSLEKGLLMLSPNRRLNFNVNDITITISKYDKECFGSEFSTSLLYVFSGMDSIVANWFATTFHGQGHLYNVFTKELVNLHLAADFLRASEDMEVADSAQSAQAPPAEKEKDKDRDSDRDSQRRGAVELSLSRLQQVLEQALHHLLASCKRLRGFKLGVCLTTVFLFFTSTSAVSFTLRQTQTRMLKFTFLLQHHVSNRLPLLSLVATHVIETLVFVPIMVGVLFFLFEFFLDKLLAFHVLSVVWMCEVYSVLSLRTLPSIRYFPRIFFLYFSLFHCYFFCCPFGFSYLALLCTVLLLCHAMLHFYFVYEVPAISLGTISMQCPRQVAPWSAGTLT